MAFISWLFSVSGRLTSSVQRLIIISSPSISGEILLRSQLSAISGDSVFIRDILNGNGLYVKTSEKHVCSVRNSGIHNQPRINLGDQGGIQRDSRSGAQRNINPKMRVGSSFRVIPEQYFSGVENVTEFLENIDSNLTYYEILTQLACAYLKSHLTGRALDWFDVLGYKVVEEKATDYAQLKRALTEQFIVVQNS
ncbi:uncharacterized protein TNCV_2806091 [Trichonephila clavipes]|nr:uncharacterized protein TNCV_2806091 [Trichonephila clavipes]